MPWYEGPTLIEVLDSIPEPKRAKEKPLRIAIREVNKIGGVGTVAIGRIFSGTLNPG